jgi:aspartyl-tRNA(Asn)/glutamyl-tRNA(Gln) amidotransferase subunit A
VEAAEYHAAALRTRLGDFGVIARRRLLAAHAFGPGAFTRAQRIRAALRRAANRALEQVDVLMLPTLPGGAVALGEPASTDYTSPFNALGWPAISVPCGRTASGLPLGVQIVAAPWREDLVLRAAAVVEAAAGVAARA